MQLAFLRRLDRWIGLSLLYALVLPFRFMAQIFPARPKTRPTLTFLKLKGGGSLIIALPALLGLRQKYADAEFVLVCTDEARIYAELTGLFDRYVIIRDQEAFSLIASGWQALVDCFHSSICLDLEPNSLLAALFTLMTCSDQRMGLVKPEDPIRGAAYTSAISFNSSAPIYIYYDQMCEMLGATPAPWSACKDSLRSLLPAPPIVASETKTIGLAPFTSAFAPERMMPVKTWIDLLSPLFSTGNFRVIIFGSARNQNAAAEMCAALSTAFLTADFISLSGSCTLAQSAAALTLCHEVWAVDSGLLHITRMLGIPNKSFWGPTMPSQRLRPLDGMEEQVSYRPFICSPCIQSFNTPPCGGNNVCMATMADEQPDLHPSWVLRQ